MAETLAAAEIADALEEARGGLRQMAGAVGAAADGDEAATKALIDGAVVAEVKLKVFLARLGVTKGSTAKLAALLHEMEAATAKLATLAQRARLTGEANSRDLAAAQAELLRETLKDVLNECRRLRDAEPRPAPASVAPAPVSIARAPEPGRNREPAGLAAARELGVEAARFVLWVRECDAEGRVPPQKALVERAGTLVALARRLEGEEEAKRLTASLVRAGQAVLFGEGSTELPELLASLERELRRVREGFGERFAAVAHVESEPVNEDEEAELAALESELDEKALSKWQKPFAREEEYRAKQAEALARRDARAGAVAARRASSTAQVRAMKSSLAAQEESLALQRRQLEELERQLHDEDTEPAQQYPAAKEVGEYGQPSAGGFMVVRKTDKAGTLEKQKTATKIRPAAPQYK